ncbi:Dipeptide-binding ABC transporter, periplasmic substrate-binding component [Enhygromyxa salina]|uniref:Dipeptide-binding ABC transporter, periplasmic substrate-binding component n=1 Tax=Enhygromyxa salina TaxID=215803 RepID=A0A0C2DE48_9BACT|nr:IgGFc-binding protein [Enhygromyxa salina]KIG17932.1 Dipeptide-binding ABC transporter, periplasmic substrate-binding component [Enhygromyxa salina]
MAYGDSLDPRISRSTLLTVAALMCFAACKPDDGPGIFMEAGTGFTLSGDGDGDATSGTETSGQECGYCEGTLFHPCEGEPIDCFDFDEVCTSQGCLPCAPGQNTCLGNDVYTCDENGEPGELVEECNSEAAEVCSEGSCANACSVADDTPSNIGCEFWAVDLPNTRGLDDASKEPWGVVLANAGQTPADVIIERNIAALGEPDNLVVLEQTNVPPGLLKTVQLPRAEITGWTPATMEPPGPTGTAKTNNAFRITSTAPIVVYQFNTFTNDFSNDASLLLPSSGLGNVHRVIGYSTANPIDLIPIAGIPDRSSVAVIGTQDGTNVTIRPGTTTKSDMISIPIGQPGVPFEVQLNQWEVLNVASDGIPGDMTGTVVEADKPVAVFSSGERAIAPSYEGDDFPTPPNWNPQEDDLCCTDHIEEQVFPATSLGKSFVITHSPERSNGGWVEPDILRFMAVAEPATVTTNLAPPHDSFTLQPGEMHEGWSQGDTIVESTTPIMVAQILVSQTYTSAFIGDPALTYFPAVEQYRERYVFLTPPTWTQNYFVLSTPYEFGGDGPSVGNFTLDGGALPVECTQEVAGMLGGVEYWSITCPVEEGAHLIEGDTDFGLTAYGYGPAGSYAYTGGADVKPIYDVPVIP